MSISLETQEKAKAIILAGLHAQSHGAVRFCYIHAEVARNAEDEEFLDMRAIYDGPYGDLNIRLLNTLHSEVRSQLLEIGISHVPSVSYVPRVEYDQLLSEQAAMRPWERIR